jgi:hypothetical protein
VAATRGQQRRLVAQVGQVGADHPRRRRGQRIQVHVAGQRHRPRVNPEDLEASGAVGRLHGDAAIEASGPQ